MDGRVTEAQHDFDSESYNARKRFTWSGSGTANALVAVAHAILVVAKAIVYHAERSAEERGE
jgi:hypothetical protein